MSYRIRAVVILGGSDMFKNPKPPADPVLRCQMRLRSLKSMSDGLDRAIANLRRGVDELKEIYARKSK